MRASHWKRAAAVTVTAALIAAACGGDDDDDDGGTDATTASVAAGADETIADDGGAETTAAASTEGDTESTEAAPETTGGDDEPATSDAASAEGIGLIDGIYVGTAGFELDPVDCPEDWDPAQGISDTEIRLYQSLPKSGPLAGFGLIADGMTSYFDYINEQGGIDGRNIVLDFTDDGYAPDKTKSNVDEAIGSGDYAALASILGTPNNLAIWDSANDECMPHLFTSSGVPDWGDVENHPWSTGSILDYFTEASLWADWLQTEHPDATTVAALTFNSDFGNSLTKGFAFATEGTDIEVVANEPHEPTAPNVDNQMTTLAATGADVLLIQTTGAFCPQALAAIERGSWKPIVIMSNTCQSLSQFFQPLIDQGLTGADTYLIQYIKDVNDAAVADDEFVQLFKEVTTAQGLDPTQTTYANGWVYAWFMVETLKLASTYEGGLDRGNIMLAARAITEDMPLLLDGITVTMNGLEDAYLIEGGQMVQYVVDDPAALGTYVPVGELLNRDGELGTFATVEAMGD